ncbi:CLUMA_CG010078, isoform A [Clunio marinus]|uniref:CLUMA_CG010078, isoform A n=1 Tax=Clunio marinus TaxID=568069 RepID=A0A1J1I8G7_9DIPT|nr:CLUMA_CG010078, isoform A [Clunio marinus]
MTTLFNLYEIGSVLTIISHPLGTAENSLCACHWILKGKVLRIMIIEILQFHPEAFVSLKTLLRISDFTFTPKQAF